MTHRKQTEHDTRTSCEMLLRMLETLPDVVFVIDDDATIVYANASAQSITGTTSEILCGNSFWRGAHQLVSTTLYQAVYQARQSRGLTDVEYVAPVTQTWLHAHLSPTVGGLMLQFHEVREPTRRQQPFPQGECLSIDDLNGLQSRIGILTPEGIVLDINEAPLGDSQVQREKVIGTPLAEIPWWFSSAASQEQLRAAIARASRGETARFEILASPGEGMYVDIEVTITPRIDTDDHVAYLLFVGSDITANKRAEEHIRVLIDTMPQFVWTCRPDGSVNYYSQSGREYVGRTTEQIQGEGWLQCLHPDDRQCTQEVWQTAVQTGSLYEIEQRLRHGTTGDYRWFLTRGKPLKDTQGTIIQWVGTSTDIDDQKRVEQQLKESRENLRVLAETVPQLVWTTLPDGKATYFNQRYCDYVGTSAEHILGFAWRQFVHPDDLERTLALRQHSLKTGEPYESEYRLKESTTGSYRWFLTRAMPVRDAADQIVKWFGTSTDIDEQKRMEEALRQSQERASALMNSSIIGITISEGEQIVEANNTYLRMTGYTREDLREGRINWMEMTPPEYLAQTLQAHQELDYQQSMIPYEKEYVCKDGSRLPVLVGRVALQANPTQGIAFILDNSARQELEQRKDDFINMASHELRSPLSAVKMQAQLVRKRLERQSHHEAARALSEVEGPIRQLERLIGELLDISKIQAGRLEYQQEMVDLGALLRESADTMQYIYPSHRLVVRGAVQACLLGDRDRLGQVFTNLISNAIKYSPDAETVEIDLNASPETVTIRVQDHGLGIPQERRDKIFERFYRAADPKKRAAIPGLGMGLYIVAEIVKRHGGSITVDSAVGKGSTFTVTFPLTRVVLA